MSIINKEGRLVFLCYLDPIDVLPDWYDSNDIDTIEEDFSFVPIDQLYTNSYMCS